MLGQYCSASSDFVSPSTIGLEPVTFQQALADYRELVGGKRIRAIRYQYVDSCDVLKAKVLAYFVDVKASNTTSGYVVSFVWQGFPMTVTFHGRNVFRLCEEY